MIRRQAPKAGTVKVTFALTDAGTNVSVVGEFNDWDPHIHPLKKRTNGTRSVAIDIPAGRSYQFRYLADGGMFFNDDDADGFEPNDRGEEHGILQL